MSAVPQCPPVPCPEPGLGTPRQLARGRAATLDGLGKCWTAALQRGPAALDLPRWMCAATDAAGSRLDDAARDRVRGAAGAAARLLGLRAPAGRPDARAPAPGRPRLVHRRLLGRAEPDAHDRRARARARLLARLGRRHRETKDASIEDYMDVVDRAVEHCGGRVNLIGDCQGGWLATIYAALHPERVNTLTIAGAPIDFHAGEPVIHEVLRRVAPGGDLRFYEALVAMGGGVLEGRAHAVRVHHDPARRRDLPPDRPPAQPRRPGPRRPLPRVRGLVQAHPGRPGRLLPVDRPPPVPRQRADQRLARGPRRRRSTSRGSTCRSTCWPAPPTTSPRPTRSSRWPTHASTPAEQVTRHVTTGGHLGLFMGHEALREHWPRDAGRGVPALPRG